MDNLLKRSILTRLPPLPYRPEVSFLIAGSNWLDWVIISTNDQPFDDGAIDGFASAA